MKTLSEAIMDDYEIERRRPESITGVQFGMDGALMGFVDRLLDDAGTGIACVDCGDGLAEKLGAQDGLYTVFVRGEVKGEAVTREQVVQCVLRALDPEADDEALMALARDAGVRFLLTYIDPVGEFPARETLRFAVMARFLAERWRAGLTPPKLVVAGESAAIGEEALRRLRRFGAEWHAGAAFDAWLGGMEMLPSLVDSLSFRADPAEAARLCTRMNYQDAMIHLAEPYGLWAVEGDPDGLPAVKTDSLEKPLALKRRLFDAGLFVMGSVGPLRGDRTLSDCMKDEPLRDLLGHAVMDEILPYAPFAREEAAPYLIECFARYENTMNENRLSDACRGLIHLARHAILPAIDACAARDGAPPRRLTTALSAMILLLSDTRMGPEGADTVVEGRTYPVRESPETIAALSGLSSDMDAESLAYAVLSDSTLWNGRDLRRTEGLLDMVVADLAG